MCSVDMTTVYPGTLTLMIEHAYAELLYVSTLPLRVCTAPRLTRSG